MRSRRWFRRDRLFFAFLVSLAVLPSTASADTIRPSGEVLVFVVSLPFWILLLRLYGLYSRDGERTDHSTVDDFTGILQAVTIGSFLFLVSSWVTGLTEPQFGRIVSFWMIAIALVSALRIAARVACR
jgi:FlaA1/EpsC-like NDP-sugar epimerase